MKIYEALHDLIEKFAPMDETTKVKLKGKASESYGKVLITVQDKEKAIEEALSFNKNNSQEIADGVKFAMPVPKLTLVEKAIKFLDNWYMEYIIAILFILAVPAIKNYMNGEKKKDEEDDGPSYEDYLAFKRMQRG